MTQQPMQFPGDPRFNDNGSGVSGTSNSVSSGGLVGDIMTGVGDFLGVIIGFGFLAIGIVLLIQSSSKVQDVERKVTGAAATLNPELAGVAVATNIATGKKPRQENVTRMFRNKKQAANRKRISDAADLATAQKQYGIRARGAEVQHKANDAAHRDNMVKTYVNRQPKKLESGSSVGEITTGKIAL